MTLLRPAVLARVVPNVPAGIAAIVAALCYSAFLLSPVTDPSDPVSRGFVSELELPGQPYAWLYRGCDVLAGLGILLAAVAAGMLLRRCRWAVPGAVALALAGFGSVLDGMWSMRCDPSTDLACARDEQSVTGLLGQLSAVHTETGLLGFVGGAAGAIFLGAAVTGRRPGWGRVLIGCGVAVAACGLGDLVLLLAHRDVGVVERGRIVLTSVVLLIVGGLLIDGMAARASGSSESGSRAWGSSELGSSEEGDR